MPSPIAHSITGYALAQLGPFRKVPLPGYRRPARRIQLFWAVFVANVPDVDFLAQFVGWDAHRGLTHSLTIMVLFSAIAGLITYAVWRPAAQWVLGFTLAVYGSHLFLDAVTAGGPGMQLLWPFSQDYFRAPFSLFPAVHHSEGLFYWGHLVFVSFELLYAALLLGFLKWRKRNQRREVTFNN